MKSIKTLYHIIRLVFFISLAVFPHNEKRNNHGSPPGEYLGSLGTSQMLVQNDVPAVDISGETAFRLSGLDGDVSSGALLRWGLDCSAWIEAERDQAETIPRGLRVFHLPRVKSGHSIDVLFAAMDFSLKATTALMVAPSYTSESVGRPSLKHWISR